MADPFTVVGSAASLVQLADFSLRFVRGLYRFIGELHDAPKEVQKLREELLQYESSVRNIRNFIDRFHTSGAVLAEYEVLPRAVEDAINGVEEDRVYLNNLTPPKNSLKISQRFKWVFNKSDVKKASERIQSRKSSLSLAMETINGFGILSIRDNTNQLQSQIRGIDDHVIATQQYISDGNSMTKQSLLILKQINTSMNSIKDGMNLGPGSHPTSAITFPNSISSSSVIETQSQRDFLSLIQHEVQSMLRPAMEQLRIDREAERESFQLMIHQCMRLMADGLSNEAEIESPKQIREDADENREAVPSYLDKNDCLEPKSMAMSTATQLRRIRLREKVWKTRTWVGRLELKVTTFRYPKLTCLDTAPDRVFYETHIDFHPSSRLSWMPAVSALYGTGPDRQGYHNLLPSIATCRIFPEDSEVARVCKNGNVNQMQNLMSKGLVAPNDQVQSGSDLLPLVFVVTVAWAYTDRENTLDVERFYNMLQLLLQQGAVLKNGSMTYFGQEYNIALLYLIYFTENYNKTPAHNLKHLELFESYGMDFSSDHWYFPFHEKDSSSPWVKDYFNHFEVDAYQLPKNAPILYDMLELYQRVNRLEAKIQEKFVLGLFERYHEFTFEEYRRYLALMLYFGVKPDKSVEQLSGILAPLTFQCLKYLQKQKVKPKDDEISTTPRWVVLCYLIEAGADIYYILPPDTKFRLDQKTHLAPVRHKYHIRPQDLWTPSLLARSCGVEDWWKAALQYWGHNPEEVYNEDLRRRAEYCRLRGANASGVDKTAVAPIGIALRKRR